jgi:SAM-dependent methyltransferase
VSRHFVDAFEAGWMKPGDRCLDVGCGLGHSDARLASRGLRVTGVDIAESAIRPATTLHAATPGLAFRTLDMTAPCDDLGPFEAIVDRGCLHVIPLPHGEAPARTGSRAAAAETSPGPRDHPRPPDRHARGGGPRRGHPRRPRRGAAGRRRGMSRADGCVPGVIPGLSRIRSR